MHPSGPKCRRCLTKKTEAAFYCLVGTLWNYDGDGKESVRKATGLISTTTTLQVHHAFSYFSLLSLHNYDVRSPNFKFTRERKRQGDKFYNLCLNSHAVPLFSSNQNSLLLSNGENWDNREKVLNNKNRSDRKCSQCARFWLKIIKEFYSVFGIYCKIHSFRKIFIG